MIRHRTITLWVVAWLGLALVTALPTRAQEPLPTKPPLAPPPTKDAVQAQPTKERAATAQPMPTKEQAPTAAPTATVTPWPTFAPATKTPWPTLTATPTAWPATAISTNTASTPEASSAARPRSTPTGHEQPVRATAAATPAPDTPAVIQPAPEVTPAALASRRDPLPASGPIASADVPLLAIGLGVNVLLAVLALGLLRLPRALAHNTRQLAVLLVRLQRASEQPLMFEASRAADARDTQVLTLLNQAGLDAARQPLQIERVLQVTAAPQPAIIAAGRDLSGRAALVVFTPLGHRPYRTARRRPAPETVFDGAVAHALERLDEALAARSCRAYTLDAFNSGLFVADDLTAAYAWLAQDLPVTARTLPRTVRWTLLVAALPPAKLSMKHGRPA